MTEGQQRERNHYYSKPLLGTFGIFEYCSSLPCLDTEYCAYRGGSRVTSSCLVPDNRYRCVGMCPQRASWTICWVETDRVTRCLSVLHSRGASTELTHIMGQRTLRTAGLDKGAGPLRIELQSESLNYNLSMIVYSENVRRKQQR